MRKLTLFICASVGLLATHAAQAHERHSLDAHHVVFVATPLGSLALAYALGLWRLMRRGAFRRRIGPWPPCSFALGLLLTAAVTTPSVAGWSEKLFSTHMAQHLVLMLICAPLFVVAQTSPILLIAVAPALQPALMQKISKIARLLNSPLAIWLGFSGLFLLWHLPGLYGAALRDERLHALEHASFFVSAYAFWSVVMSPASRQTLGYGSRLFFVVSAALISGLPGALIALSSRPLYPTDLQATARLGLTPLEDQQLAGLVMWIPGGLAYMAAALALLLRWLDEAERKARRKLPNASLALLGGALLSMTLAACDETGLTLSRREESQRTDGDPRKGAEAIAAIGCGACHTIPGVNGAVGLVGPPLDHMGRRIYIAGLLRNTPENMQAWLQDPQKFAPGVVMPNMGLTSDQSRNVAAYLSTLQ